MYVYIQHIAKGLTWLFWASLSFHYEQCCTAHSHSLSLTHIYLYVVIHHANIFTLLYTYIDPKCCTVITLPPINTHAQYEHQILYFMCIWVKVTRAVYPLTRRAANNFHHNIAPHRPRPRRHRHRRVSFIWALRMLLLCIYNFILKQYSHCNHI